MLSVGVLYATTNWDGVGALQEWTIHTFWNPKANLNTSMSMIQAHDWWINRAQISKLERKNTNRTVHQKRLWVPVSYYCGSVKGFNEFRPWQSVLIFKQKHSICCRYKRSEPVVAAGWELSGPESLDDWEVSVAFSSVWGLLVAKKQVNIQTCTLK